MGWILSRDADNLLPVDSNALDKFKGAMQKNEERNSSENI